MQKQRKKQWILIAIFVFLSSSFLFLLWKNESTAQRIEQEQAKTNLTQLTTIVKDTFMQTLDDIKTEKKQAETSKEEIAVDEETTIKDEPTTNQEVSTTQPKEEIADHKQVTTPPSTNETNPVEKPEVISYVTIRIDASNIVSHMDKVSAAVVPFIPKSGVVLADTQIALQENDTVYSVLQRACAQQGISLDANNGYVRYIHDFGEFDAGNTSGWLYTVNGALKSVGAASYKVAENDVIVWHYTVIQGDVS